MQRYCVSRLVRARTSVLFPMPSRTMSSSSAHAAHDTHHHAKSASAEAYDTQIPYLYGATVSVGREGEGGGGLERELGNQEQGSGTQEHFSKHIEMSFCITTSLHSPSFNPLTLTLYPFSRMCLALFLFIAKVGKRLMHSRWRVLS